MISIAPTVPRRRGLELPSRATPGRAGGAMTIALWALLPSCASPRAAPSLPPPAPPDQVLPARPAVADSAEERVRGPSGTPANAAARHALAFPEARVDPRDDDPLLEPDRPERGSMAASSAAGSGADDRIWATEGLAKIYEKPGRDERIIGAFRAGQSLALRGTEPVTSQRLYRCERGWYPVEPRGWVCVGGIGHPTFDGDHPRVVAARVTLPDTSKAYPFRYGVSIGAPQYLRIPTPAEQRQQEPGLDQHLADPPEPDPHDGGAVDLRRAGQGTPPALLRYIEQQTPELVHEKPAFEGMKVAWSREFDAQGRTWLLTPQLTLIPKDKVRVQPLPRLRGVDLRNEPERPLPLAFTWLRDAPKYRRNEDGKIVPTEETWPRHTFFPATGTMERCKGGVCWKMADGDFATFADVTIIKRAPFRPKGVGPNDKWVYVRITWGYLLAYEGDTPIYAAAVSPGVDGISARAHTTMKGRHRIGWKMLSGDMDGKDKGKYWFVDEVPWVQYYKDSFALHGAWWHDDFGRPKSHGCINLSPYDAQVLFRWMDPQLPEGWYAATSYYPHVQGTLIQVRH